MHKKYPVTLSEAERVELQELVRAGTAPARQLAHARILLKADQSPGGPAWVDQAIADALEISQPTVSRIRKQYVEQGLTATLNRRMPRRSYTRKLDGAHEARLVALACSAPPKGQVRWSLRLLADKLVELEVVEVFHTKPCDVCSKKRAEAVAEAAMEHPAQGQRRVRLPHGGCARRLYAPL